MSRSNYFIISSETKKILNLVEIEDESVSTFNNYHDENISCVPFSVASENEIYARPDGSCQYFSDQNVFQPVEPESETWTKNSDGIWNEILMRPNANSFWSASSNGWVDCTEYMLNDVEMPPELD